MTTFAFLLTTTCTAVLMASLKAEQVLLIMRTLETQVLSACMHASNAVATGIKTKSSVSIMHK